MRPKIIRMLNDTRRTPAMYSQSIEAMLMRVTTLLEVAGVQFSVVEFYCKHSGKNGNCYLLEKPKDMSFDSWSHQVVDDALSMLNGEENEYTQS
jgi:hypothetical protein